MSPHLEADCENAFRILRHWRKKSNFQEFGRMRHSSIEFFFFFGMLLLLMYKMVLEIELQHAEGFHTLARTQIPEFMLTR